MMPKLFTFLVTLSPYRFRVTAPTETEAISSAISLWWDNEDACPEALVGEPKVYKID